MNGSDSLYQRIKLSKPDVSNIKDAANKVFEYVLNIAQGCITISAKSLLGYSLLDYDKPMMLIIHDCHDQGIMNRFSDWFYKEVLS